MLAGGSGNSVIGWRIGTLGKASGGILSNGKGGGDYNIKREPAAPAEIDVKKTVGIRADYKLVMLQANAVGIGASFILSGIVAAIFAFGPLVFWIIAGIVGITTLIWWMRQESRIVYLLDEGKISGEDTTSVNVGQGIIVTLFCGFVAWCFWRVLNYVNPRTWTDLTWQDMAIRIAALASLNFVVFAVFRFLILFVAFGQDAIQRSPMQQQFIWQAAGKILETWGLTRIRRPRGRRPLIQTGRPIKSNGNGGGGNGRVEVETDFEDELSAEQEEGLELIQFLVLGQLLKNDKGETILYSRRQWDGIRLPTGRTVGVSYARRLGDTLQEVGVLEERSTSTGKGLNIARDYTLHSAIEQIAVEYDIEPPHPREWESWAKGARVPT